MSRLRYDLNFFDSNSSRKNCYQELIPFFLHVTFDKAAYADMINTTIDQKGISLSEKELLNLNRGGRMWEEGTLNLNTVMMQFPIRPLPSISFNSQLRRAYRRNHIQE
jgi:hypothetical protein